VVTDRLHINSLAFLDNGDTLVSCGLIRVVDNLYLHTLNNQLKKSCLSELLPKLYNLYKRLNKNGKNAHFEAKQISKSKSDSIILRLTPTGQWSESLVIPDCIVPSHSIRILGDKTAIYLNSTSGELIHFDPCIDAIISATKVGKGFLRGARELSNGSLLIGDNNDVVHFSLDDRKILCRTKIAESPSEAVFDINVLPQGFDLPPKSFPEWHKDFPEVNQQTLNHRSSVS
jgi:hypothetical protein